MYFTLTGPVSSDASHLPHYPERRGINSVEVNPFSSVGSTLFLDNDNNLWLQTRIIGSYLDGICMLSYFYKFLQLY